MSFVTWLVLPMVVTTIATLIMMLAGRKPHTDTHQDIESFARFRGALERQTASDRPAREEAPAEPTPYIVPRSGR
jgi:hypothetical protein